MSESKYKLTAIVPVSGMHGQLQLMRKWLPAIDKSSTQVVIVHDIADNQTAIELEEIQESLGSSNLLVRSGVFGNPGSARNIGLEVTEGKWICFWDSDDEPFPRKVLEMIDQAEVSGNDVAVGEFEVRSTNQTIRFPFPHTKAVPHDFPIELAIHPGLWRWAFRREVLEEVEFLPLKMAEDQTFLSSANIWDKKVMLFHEVVYSYTTGRSGQLTMNPVAINDLVRSMNYSARTFKTKSEIMKKYLLLLWIRQFATLVKKGSTKAKLQSLPNLVQLFFHSLRRPKLIINFLKSIRQEKKIGSS